MDRRRWIQTTAAPLALLFLGALAGEAYGLHACPVHHHTSDAPVQRTALHAGSAPPSGEAPPPICGCVGSCHGAAASPVPSTGAAAALPAAPAVRRGAEPLQRRTHREIGSFFLPFPTGPPTG